MYQALDIAFLLFHTLLILFIVFGWAWERTRRLNLAVCLLTAFSWLVLGVWYGFGYCPCTEWHWRVRERLDHAEMPASYIKFLLDALTGLDAPVTWVDTATTAVFAAALTASLAVNLRDWRRRHTEPESE